MDGLLRPGTVLVSEAGVQYRVAALLGAGGQGEVYQVEADGSQKALKWYFPKNAQSQQRKILERLVEMGAPDGAFLWPEDMITAPDGKTFGYIMPLRPRQYKGLVDLLKCRVDPSFFVRCRTAFNLARAYEKLHSMGNCYRDINYGNLFFDPATGDVLICDNDNVAPKDMPGLVQGTYGFMAPEIIRGEARPSRYTDQYSLAVLLFYIFCVAHPLHGKLEASIRCLDIPAQDRLYGTHPVFIYDPDNEENRPVSGVHDNAIVYWKLYPQELKDLFTESFTVGLRNPNQRVTEKRWMNAMANLMGGIVPCPKCGAELFYDPQKVSDGQAHLCWRCRAAVPMPHVLKIGKQRQVLLPNAVLRAYLLDSGSDIDAVAGTVIQNPKNPKILGLRNDSTANWTYLRADGTQTVVPPGRAATAAKDAKISFGSKTGEFM